MENCDDHGGGKQRLGECVTVFRECDSHQGGVKGIRNVIWRGVMVMWEV